MSQGCRRTGRNSGRLQIDRNGDEEPGRSGRSCRRDQAGCLREGIVLSSGVWCNASIRVLGTRGDSSTLSSPTKAQTKQPQKAQKNTRNHLCLFAAYAEVM